MIATKNGQALKLTKKMAKGRYLTEKVKVMKQIVPEALRVSKTQRFDSTIPYFNFASDSYK